MGSREDNIKATKFVLDTLNAQEIQEINFQLNNINVSSSMYQKVSQAVTEGKITVIVAPEMLNQTESGRFCSRNKTTKRRRLV